MIGAAIGAVTGLAGSLIGGNAASKAARKANRLLDQQVKDNQAWYDRRYNEDYTQSAEAQAALLRARELVNEQYRKTSGAAAVGGATEEAVAQQKAANNEVIKDVVSNIADNATARKDAVEQQYLSKKSDLTNQRISVLNQKAANAAQAGSQVAGAGMGLVGADMSSHLNNGKGLFEAMFKKKGA